jgi:hypothetical protein
MVVVPQTQTNYTDPSRCSGRRRVLAERFRAALDPERVKQLGDQLGRFVFGE